MDAPSDFSLSDNSPAIGEGIGIGLVTSDFYGNAMNTPPDLGAIQYGSDPITTIFESETEKGLIIDPNPAQSTISISVPFNYGEKYQIRIYTLHGQLIFESENYSSNSAEIFVETLPRGVFIVSAISNAAELVPGKLLILE
jgi:hypothetical protein